MKNSEEITQIYKSLGSKIDDYIDNWGVSPKNLKSYLSGKRLKKFLETEGFGEFEGAERIVNDIIQDRIHLEVETVKTFESFNMENLEDMNNFWVGIGKATIEHEKILADYYDLSLSEIDVIDSDKHEFDAGGIPVVVFTKEELEKISENITLSKFRDISRMELEIFQDVKIKLSDVLNGEKLNLKISDLVREGLFEFVRESLHLMKVDNFKGNLIGFL